MKVPPVFDRALRRLGGPANDIAGARVLPAARLGGPMPWVIAIMVALCVLAAGGALALANFTARAEAGLNGGLTVQIVEADPVGREAQTRAAKALLEGDRAVAEVQAVPETELARLVEPLLGDAARSSALVLPALIDVRLTDAAPAGTAERLRSALATVAPSARLDAQAAWLEPIFGAIRALRWLAVMLIALLMLASSAAVWLAARNAFDANRETIMTVHHLGAGDAQLARLFQRAVLTDAAIGGAIGLAIGGVTLAFLGARFAGLDSGLVANGAFDPGDWLLVALVPVIMAGVALATARRTVLSRLGRML